MYERLNQRQPTESSVSNTSSKPQTPQKTNATGRGAQTNPRLEDTTAPWQSPVKNLPVLRTYDKYLIKSRTLGPFCRIADVKCQRCEEVLDQLAMCGNCNHVFCQACSIQYTREGQQKGSKCQVCHKSVRSCLYQGS